MRGGLHYLTFKSPVAREQVKSHKLELRWILYYAQSTKYRTTTCPKVVTPDQQSSRPSNLQIQRAEDQRLTWLIVTTSFILTFLVLVISVLRLLQTCCLICLVIDNADTNGFYSSAVSSYAKYRSLLLLECTRPPR